MPNYTNEYTPGTTLHAITELSVALLRLRDEVVCALVGTKRRAIAFVAWTMICYFVGIYA